MTPAKGMLPKVIGPAASTRASWRLSSHVAVRCLRGPGRAPLCGAHFSRSPGSKICHARKPAKHRPFLRPRSLERCVAPNVVACNVAPNCGGVDGEARANLGADRSRIAGFRRAGGPSVIGGRAVRAAAPAAAEAAYVSVMVISCRCPLSHWYA
jgi:hypothetical protein